MWRNVKMNMNWKVMGLAVALGVGVLGSASGAEPSGAEQPATEQPTTEQPATGQGTVKKSTPAQPAGGAYGAGSTTSWAVGIGAKHASSPYKKYDDNDLVAIPAASYEKGKFFWYGTEAGVKVYRRNAHSIHVGVSWKAHEFSPKDTDDLQLQFLDKRKPTLMADVSYIYRGKIGIARVKASVDVLGRSDGMVLDASYRYPVVKAKKFQTLAGAGVEWANGMQNDYYYGVTQEEAQRSGLKAYKAENGLTPYLTVEAKYDISKRWSAFAVGKLSFLNGEVKDSHMVDKSTTYYIGAGLLYKF